MQKILIANRGEIALRIQRTCQEMGIKTVAVHSQADSDAMHVKLADESVCIGPASIKDSYLCIPNIISAAELTGADGIHPGYGFLSENQEFAKIVQAHNLIFIGPSPEHIESMGNKVQAKKIMEEAGVPVMPGSLEKLTEANLSDTARNIGYPLLLKASTGGGGIGMLVARSEDDLQNSFRIARAQSVRFFGSDEIYMEKFLENPRHIEIQIVCDKYGNVIHLNERDCSIQRRNQKMIEETPSPALTQKERDYLGSIAVNAMKKIGYDSIGTLEFLYQDGDLYFIEMNTRLQVEHTITEEVTGVDLVEIQIKISEGKQLEIKQEDIKTNGHAMQCRITCEDPKTLLPTAGGIVKDYHPPGGKGIRVESGLYSGYRVPPYYDSLISKLVVQGINRDKCIKKMRRALQEYIITGVVQTIPAHIKILQQEDFLKGDYNIHWMENKLVAHLL